LAKVKKVVLGILGVGILAFVGWKLVPAGQETKTVHDEITTSDSDVAVVQRRNLDYTITSTGDIAPAVQIEVKPEISARIKRLPVEIGQIVKRGDLLLDLDDRELQTEKESQETEIRGTQVSLEQAKRLYDRSKALYAKNLIAKQEFENAKTALDVAQNNLDRAGGRLRSVQDRLAKTQVFAPIDGMVLSIPVVTGQVVVAAASVSSGTLLLTIANLKDMVITTHVNQVDISHIKPKQKVDFVVDSVRDKTMHGTVSLISPIATVKNNTKGFPVTVLIDELDPSVRPGMTANLTFPISRSPNALAVPLSAVFSTPDNDKVVYVPSPDPQAAPVKRKVELGIVNFDYAEIKSGLKEGDKVFLTKPASS
jgi:RND family efflux transporter MFP subunit